jgi:hypothetical protein
MQNDVERCVGYCKKNNLSALSKEFAKGPQLKDAVSFNFSDSRSLDFGSEFSDLFAPAHLRSLWQSSVFKLLLRPWKPTIATERFFVFPNVRFSFVWFFLIFIMLF